MEMPAKPPKQVYKAKKTKGAGTCANCAWSGPPATIWDTVFVRCEVNGAGQKLTHTCPDWVARPA